MPRFLYKRVRSRKRKPHDATEKHQRQVAGRRLNGTPAPRDGAAERDIHPFPLPEFPAIHYRRAISRRRDATPDGKHATPIGRCATLPAGCATPEGSCGTPQRSRAILRGRCATPFASAATPGKRRATPFQSRATPLQSCVSPQESCATPRRRYASKAESWLFLSTFRAKRPENPKYE